MCAAEVLTVTCVGADTINQVLQFQQQANVTHQVVSRWNASVAFQDANTGWRTWRVQPTPQDAATGILPNNGHSTLTIRVEAVGAHAFVEQFVYQVQYAEWYVLQPPGHERGVNFIPVGENPNWWKWSLA